MTVLIKRSGSRISQIIPDITVEENFEDRLAITVHPVENGATISDHCFLLPKVIEIRAGWSDSSAGQSGSARDAYNQLLSLQARREPFTVSTGKRNHNNMLVSGISVTDDVKTKFTLMVSIRLQEVRIVSAQSTNGAGSSNASEQSAAQSTLGEANIGEIQPGTANWGASGPQQPGYANPTITSITPYGPNGTFSFSSSSPAGTWGPQ